MSTNFNFTGRVDLDANQVSFGIVESESKAEVEVKWDLRGLSLPSTSTLMLKATSVFDTIIFNLGAHEVGTGNAVFDIRSIRNYSSAKFTFQVLEPDSLGIPLIRATRESKAETLNGVATPQSSLLETRSNSEIKQPWKVSVEDGRPILDISSELHQELLSSSFFDPLVIPAVLERILEWLILPSEKNIEIAEKWETFFREKGVKSELFDDFKDDAALTLESLKEAQDLIQAGVGEVAQFLGAKELLKKIFEE